VSAREAEIASSDALAAAFAGRTVAAVDWHRGVDWGDEDKVLFTLDDGAVIQMYASGWHGSGAVDFYLSGV
jgi:hypothetical protein